jgi:DNA-binding winged helix-turn-helix (wHTH) protein/TolB-like protein/Tfp pilus assembly protein PilF
MAAAPTYAFGPYRLETAGRRLIRDGEPVGLTPKAFDTLVALVERRDRVVDKAELMKVVWPDSFVEEANLSQTIFVLRKSLGEDANGRQYIDTIPRRGYRFTAEVRTALSAPTRPPAIVWGTAAVAAVIIVALAATTWTTIRARRAPDPLAGKTRVVVLPFENLTRDPADDWLASAFSDSVTAGLEGIEDFICVSRDRIVELYRQQAIREAAAADAGALRQVSQTLGAGYYVHGSYQRLGDRIKVVAQLVERNSGTIRAQETLTDDVANLLKLEEDLAGRFGTKLAAGQRAPVRHRETSSLEAYQAVISGRNAYALGQFDVALASLQRAVQLDPSYATAWALLGKTNARLTAGSSYASGSIDALNQTALTSARRAVELDPSLYEAHTALALAYRELEQIEPWRAAALKAVELNPRAAEAYVLLADLYFVTPGFGCSRNHDDALAESYYRTALNIDPRFSQARGNLSYHLHWAGRIDEALRVADEGLAELPGSRYLRRARSMALVWANRLSDAERETREIIKENESLEDRWVLATIALKRGGASSARQEFTAILQAMPATVYDFQIARSYFFANQIDEGLSHVDQAVRRNPACAEYAATVPAFAPYRDSPQFRARLAYWKR